MSFFEKPSYALKYPTSNDESKYGPILKLAVAVVLSVLVIPALTVYGYGFRVIEHAMNGQQMPRFENPVQLTEEGLIAFVVTLPFTVLSVSVRAVPADSAALGLVAVVLWLLFAYLSPAVHGLHAHNRTFKGTYDLGKIRELLTSKHYLIATTGFLLFQFFVAIVTALSSVLIVTIPLAVAVYLTATNAYIGAVLSPAFDDDPSAR